MDLLAKIKDRLCNTVEAVKDTINVDKKDRQDNTFTNSTTDSRKRPLEVGSKPVISRRSKRCRILSPASTSLSPDHSSTAPDHSITNSVNLGSVSRAFETLTHNFTTKLVETTKVVTTKITLNQTDSEVSPQSTKRIEFKYKHSNNEFISNISVASPALSTVILDKNSPLVATAVNSIKPCTMQLVNVRPGTDLASKALPPPLPPSSAPPAPTELIRWVLIGPPQAGKTALVSSFCQREYYHNSNSNTANGDNVSNKPGGNVAKQNNSTAIAHPAAPKEWVPMELSYAKKDYAFTLNGKIRSVRLQLYDTQVGHVHQQQSQPPMWLQNLWQRSDAILLILPLEKSWTTSAVEWKAWLQRYYTSSGSSESTTSRPLPPLHLLLSQVDKYQHKWTETDAQKVRLYARQQASKLGFASVHLTTATPSCSDNDNDKSKKDPYCVTMDTVVQSLLSITNNNNNNSSNDKSNNKDKSSNDSSSKSSSTSTPATPKRSTVVNSAATIRQSQRSPVNIKATRSAQNSPVNTKSTRQVQTSPLSTKATRQVQTSPLNTKATRQVQTSPLTTKTTRTATTPLPQKVGSPLNTTANETPRKQQMANREEVAPQTPNIIADSDNALNDSIKVLELNNDNKDSLRLKTNSKHNDSDDSTEKVVDAESGDKTN